MTTYGSMDSTIRYAEAKHFEYASAPLCQSQSICDYLWACATIIGDR